MLYANGQPVGGKDNNSVELTYAQYMALSQAQKMNGTEYFITDINGDGSQFQPVVYSTEEREIGVWTDGKPLYKKTWIFSSELTISQTSFTDTSIDATDIDNIIRVEAIHDDGTCFEGVMADPTKSNHTIVGLQTARNNNGCSIMKLTLQYTKISDTPGSGTWTPQGVPAVHYSTEEQIVGTWIDGSTIYGKVFELQNSLLINADSWGDTSISNTDKAVIIDVKLWDTNGSIFTQIGANRDSQLGYVQILNSRNAAISINKIYLEYTKTS